MRMVWDRELAQRAGMHGAAWHRRSSARAATSCWLRFGRAASWWAALADSTTMISHQHRCRWLLEGRLTSQLACLTAQLLCQRADVGEVACGHHQAQPCACSQGKGPQGRARNKAGRDAASRTPRGPPCASSCILAAQYRHRGAAGGANAAPPASARAELFTPAVTQCWRQAAGCPACPPAGLP